MPTLYLTEQGAVLKKEGRRLVVEKQGEKLLDVPLIKIDAILIYGNVQVTTQALSLLFESGVETAFLTMEGKLKGQLTPIKSKNVPLRMAQYRRAHEREFKLKVARTIVRAKIENSISVLRRYQYNHPEVDFTDRVKKLDRFLQSLERKTEAQTLLGVEGSATVEYFSGLKEMFRGELRFQGRNRRPPRDPVNSLLSFGYVLVFNELTSLLDAMGFDPYIGFLHGIDYGRPSLALDILEEFRAAVDRFVLTLCNKRVFKPEDFEDRPASEDGAVKGVYLKKEPLKKFFVEYERWIGEKRGKDRLSFRDRFRLQSQRMSKAILEGVGYKPYKME